MQRQEVLQGSAAGDASEDEPATRLRDHSVGEARKVTKFELFFGLVYVFAVTHLLHRPLEPGAGVALEKLALFLAVWWAWNYTACNRNYAQVQLSDSTKRGGRPPPSHQSMSGRITVKRLPLPGL